MLKIFSTTCKSCNAILALVKMLNEKEAIMKCKNLNCKDYHKEIKIKED